MLVTNDMSQEEFIKVFKKKFESFCEKSPMKIRYFLDGLDVVIEDLSPLLQNGTGDFNLIFNLDFKVKVETNIFNIRQLLEKHYPIIYQKKLLSFEEMKKHYELTKEEKSEDIIPMYKIVKVLNDSNKIIIEDVNTKAKIAYQFSSSVYKFINDVVYKQISDEDILYFNMFKSHSLSSENIN